MFLAHKGILDPVHFARTFLTFRPFCVQENDMKRPDPFVLLTLGSTMSLAFHKLGLCPLPPLMQRPRGQKFPRIKNVRQPRGPQCIGKGPFKVCS